MQRLLLRAIGEAVFSGVSKIILILAPGTIESLYTPLKEALAMAVVPSIKLHYSEQVKPEGLGDAILHAEALVGKEPFAVLLPDDQIKERMGWATSKRSLRRMMSAFSELDSAFLIAVTEVPKSKMPRCGVAEVGQSSVIPKIFPIIKLVEKPDPTNEIFREKKVFGIVGRYLLQPDIFGPLQELKKQLHRPVELTDALERLRQAGHNIYAFSLEAKRQDVGEVLGQASELIGDTYDQENGTT
jgi:UTP--glucose-1-phosphate uridylyltransferase